MAALSLARMVDLATAPPVRRTVVVALERASRRDRDRQVRGSAGQALERLRAALAPPAPPPARRNIFVHVGAPADPSRALPAGGGEELVAALRGSLHQYAPDYELASGLLPTGAELESRQLRGFTVNASVAQVAVEQRGSRASVSCTVAVRVGPWTGRDGNERMAADQSASASGRGHVTVDRGGTRRAAVDCAVAVTEELAERQLIPFLRRLAAAR